MPKLRYVRPPVPRDVQALVDDVLSTPDGAPEEPLYRPDDLARVVRQLAAEGSTDSDIAARTGVRSLARVKQLREQLGCTPDPERADVWDRLADDEPPEAA